jgi:hypothetical protein
VHRIDPHVPRFAVDPDVSILHWPAEEHLRQQLDWFGLPRLLLVEPGVAPPTTLGDAEDWMRIPAAPEDLEARVATLRRRATETVRLTPLIDDDDLLWAGGAWVSLTAVQAPVMRLLLEHFDRVVGFEAVAAAYESGGGSSHPAAVRTLLNRLGPRVRSVGLELVTVRRRGVLLTCPAATVDGVT